MIKRLLKFKKQDWKHILWLTKNMIIRFLIFDFEDSYEAFLLIKVHLYYDSEII